MIVTSHRVRFGATVASCRNNEPYTVRCSCGYEVAVAWGGDTTARLVRVIAAHESQRWTWTMEELATSGPELERELELELERTDRDVCADWLAALERAIIARLEGPEVEQLGRLAQLVNARVMFGAF